MHASNNGMDVEDENYDDLVAAQNRRNKKAGGFQAMGLDHAVFKGITKKGYRVPTPIQRKAIPLILSGKDVVAMARTGSGKTAAFLIPMFQRLKGRRAQTGARALLISPTRELALQTYQFAKEMGRFTGLRATVIVGGDSMEEQFATIHENPDIIIATPGRLLHVVMEMNLQLKSVEYVVFDEADRLFEMGFEEQLMEVLKRLPDNRQTLLFSATLPRFLVDFAKAGLNEPTLVRLDVENKISDLLKLIFLHCRHENKVSLLLHLLSELVEPNEQTIVFCATKHHVEYLKEILLLNGVSTTYLYSALDADARKINTEKFRNRKARVLVVTDVAARGVDLPLLDVVINVHFPPKPKLFVHRVGRVARAGRTGRAISIVSPEEMPYFMDLLMFLTRPVHFAQIGQDIPEEADDILGSIPQSAVDPENEKLSEWLGKNVDIAALKQVADNAYKQFVRSRPPPSGESVKRVKEDPAFKNLAVHPIFAKGPPPSEELQRISIIEGIRNYKPQLTVFELMTSNKHESWSVMKAKRQAHQRKIVPHIFPSSTTTSDEATSSSRKPSRPVEVCSEELLKETFKAPPIKKQKRSDPTVNKDYFVPYQPVDVYSERGLAVDKGGGFDHAIRDAVLDFTSDEIKHKRNDSKGKTKWDRKKKKFVGEAEGDRMARKIRTESGVLIPASYKTDIYAKWRQKNRLDYQGGTEEFEGGDEGTSKPFPQGRRGKRKGEQSDVGGKSKGPQRRELKTKEEIVKQRKQSMKLKERMNKNRDPKGKKRQTNSHKGAGGKGNKRR